MPRGRSSRRRVGGVTESDPLYGQSRTYDYPWAYNAEPVRPPQAPRPPTPPAAGGVAVSRQPGTVGGGLAAAGSPSAPLLAPPANGAKAPSKKWSDLSKGTRAAIIVSIVVVVGGIIGLVVWLATRSSSSSSDDNGGGGGGNNGGDGGNNGGGGGTPTSPPTTPTDPSNPLAAESTGPGGANTIPLANGQVMRIKLQEDTNLYYGVDASGNVVMVPEADALELTLSALTPNAGFFTFQLSDAQGNTFDIDGATEGGAVRFGQFPARNLAAFADPFFDYAQGTLSLFKPNVSLAMQVDPPQSAGDTLRWRSVFGNTVVFETDNINGGGSTGGGGGSGTPTAPPTSPPTTPGPVAPTVMSNGDRFRLILGSAYVGVDGAGTSLVSGLSRDNAAVFTCVSRSVDSGGFALLQFAFGNSGITASGDTITVSTSVPAASSTVFRWEVLDGSAAPNTVENQFIYLNSFGSAMSAFVPPRLVRSGIGNVLEMAPSGQNGDVFFLEFAAAASN